MHLVGVEGRRGGGIGEQKIVDIRTPHYLSCFMLSWYNTMRVPTVMLDSMSYRPVAV